jgi:hypothetical protein
MVTAECFFFAVNCDAIYYSRFAKMKYGWTTVVWIGIRKHFECAIYVVVVELMTSDQ